MDEREVRLNWIAQRGVLRPVTTVSGFTASAERWVREYAKGRMAHDRQGFQEIFFARRVDLMMLCKDINLSLR